MTEETLHNELTETGENEAVSQETTVADTEYIQDLTTDTTDLSKLKGELEEAKDKYLRLFAEFDNFKKRTMKERLDLIRTASQETLQAMLPVLDDFDRAKKASEMPGSTEVFSEGVNLVYHKLMGIMEGKGLKAMSSTGESFDPEKHEAITEIPAPTADLAGKVVDKVEKGYYLHDKIIRYAKVVVGK